MKNQLEFQTEENTLAINKNHAEFVKATEKLVNVQATNLNDTNLNIRVDDR